MSQSQPPDQQPNIDIQDSENVNLIAGDRNLQGDENQAVSGTNNQVQQLKIGRVEKLVLGQEAQSAAESKRSKNEQILLTAVATEVTDRLRQSLHNAVFINLPKENQRDRVRRPWDGDVKIGTGEKQPIPPGQSVFQVFQQDTIRGKLLILGQPGAGKTTTLLDLARELIEIAQRDMDAPIPVLFNLSSWGSFPKAKGEDDATHLARWMVNELNSKYGVSQKLGQTLLEEHKLLPLLDGLDEVAAAHQVACLHAVNQWLGSDVAPMDLTVCCREEEYNQLVNASEERLHLNGAICLKPLTAPQVQKYLTTLDCADLWDAIQQDEQLTVLVQTPLWLSLSVLARKELDLERWSQAASLEKRREQLCAANAA